MRAQDWNGEMPLHFAALNEDVPIVKQLLLAGADPLAPDAVLDTDSAAVGLRSGHKSCAHGPLEKHVVHVPFELAGIVRPRRVRQFEAALPKPLSHGGSDAIGGGVSQQGET